MQTDPVPGKLRNKTNNLLHTEFYIRSLRKLCNIWVLVARSIAGLVYVHWNVDLFCVCYRVFGTSALSIPHRNNSMLRRNSGLWGTHPNSQEIREVAVMQRRQEQES